MHNREIIVYNRVNLLECIEGTKVIDGLKMFLLFVPKVQYKICAAYISPPEFTVYANGTSSIRVFRSSFLLEIHDWFSKCS